MGLDLKISLVISTIALLAAPFVVYVNFKDTDRTNGDLFDCVFTSGTIVYLSFLCIPFVNYIGLLTVIGGSIYELYNHLRKKIRKSGFLDRKVIWEKTPQDKKRELETQIKRLQES